MGWIEKKPTDESERKTRQTRSQEEDGSLAPAVQLTSCARGRSVLPGPLGGTAWPINMSISHPSTACHAAHDRQRVCRKDRVDGSVQ